MINNFKEIFVLPPIVQGVIGSALFWLILKVGAFLLSKSKHHIETFSSSARQIKEVQEYIFLKYRENPNLLYFSKGYFMCFNSAFRNIVLGLFWISLGLMFVNTNEIFLTIGITGGMIFFAKAISWLPDISKFTEPNDKIDERIKELETSLARHTTSLSKAASVLEKNNEQL